MKEVTVLAEAPIAGGRRIDLLLKWKDSANESYAVAIEAKLGHDVTTGQLPAYRRHLQRIAGEGCLELVVVSPQRKREIDASLRRNRDWKWMGWRELLIAHERALADEFDDNAYLQFRRTLWDQTG